MTTADAIMIITLGSASMSIIFLFMVTRDIQPNEKRLIKIFGQELTQKFKNATNEEEIKELIRNMSKKQKTKLKTLLESQDIRDALHNIKTHIRKEKVE